MTYLVSAHVLGFVHPASNGPVAMSIPFPQHPYSDVEQFLLSSTGFTRGGHFGSLASVVRACSRVVGGAGHKLRKIVLA